MKLTILVVVALLLSACGSSPVAPDVSVRLIGYGGLVTSTSGVAVVLESYQWEPFIRQVNLRAPSGLPEAPLPTVNFPDEMAVGLFLGARPSTAYRVRVDRVVRGQNALVIHATEEIGCVGATVITYPLTAVAVPRSTATPEVAWSTARLPCS